MRALGAGDEIADYRIEALAGRGGMGVVYRARQRRPDRTVALKVIAPELAADPAFRERFELESAIAAQIEHPNVIPVYGVGEDDGLLFIAMRFVPGSDLGALLAQSGPLHPSRAAHILAQVAGALDAAHAHGLVHRDVKPGNVLVADDVAYLTDFGLTKRLADSGGLTATGLVLGTLNYIAPEQIEGRPVDARADIYALGCVAYEVMSGQVPFQKDTDVAKLYAHVNEPAPRLTGVPPPMADAVARAMAKDPSDRFPSAGDFGRALGAGAAGQLPSGAERSVAVGRAALADDRAATKPRGETVRAPGPVAGTERSEAPETIQARRQGGGDDRLAERSGRDGSGHRTRWLLALGGVLIVALAGAVVAVAVSRNGGSGSKTIQSSASHSSSTGSGSTTTVSTTPSVNPARQILAPATTPPKVNECRMQLEFGADGTAGPPKCANGDLNSVAWKSYVQNSAYRRILGLGEFASPQQVINAMCASRNITIPQIMIVYELASTYYGWKFGVDPSSEFPNVCQ